MSSATDVHMRLVPHRMIARSYILSMEFYMRRKLAQYRRYRDTVDLTCLRPLLATLLVAGMFEREPLVLSR
jgi:hypothetical protein